MLPLGPLRLHPHLLFDLLAYSGGFRLFLWQRRRLGDTVDTHARWSIVAAAILGLPSAAGFSSGPRTRGRRLRTGTTRSSSSAARRLSAR
jgi:hypothetical protein